MIIQMGLSFLYHVRCLDKYGNIKWEELFHNLTTTEGVNSLGNVYFRAQTQITAWYVGLKQAGTIAAGDTAASHAGDPVCVGDVNPSATPNRSPKTYPASSPAGAYPSTSSRRTAALCIRSRADRSGGRSAGRYRSRPASVGCGASSIPARPRASSSGASSWGCGFTYPPNVCRHL